jgi:25S rRNA (adenine2142-N1)-methyltransferase
MKSRRVARKATTTFHRLTHEIDRVRSDETLDVDTKTTMLDDLKQQLEDSGGRKTYQDASIVNTSMFRTSKYVTSTLTRLGIRKGSGQPLPKLLEVGAINVQLLTTKWLSVDALDIQSRHPKIQQMNFFDFPMEENKYDAVVCSMVINCVPTPLLRGQLLVDCRKHLKLGGHYFIMLPLLCLNSTPHVAGKEQFRRGVESLGFQFVEEKLTKKVALFCFEKIDVVRQDRVQMIFPNPPRIVVRGKYKKFASDFAISLVRKEQ